MPIQPGRQFQGATGNAAIAGAAAGIGHTPSASNTSATHPRYVGGEYNINLKLTVATANLAVLAEPMGAPSGSTVRIRTSEKNAGTMYFAESREALLGGQGQEIGAGFEVIFPYEKGKLWFMGDTVADYAILSARSQ